MNRSVSWLSLLGFVLLVTVACWCAMMVVFYISSVFGYPLDPIVDFAAFFGISVYLSMLASVVLCVVGWLRRSS